MNETSKRLKPGDFAEKRSGFKRQRFRPADRNNKVSCHHYTCEIEIAMEVLGGKWKALIIWNLGQRDVIRYNAFRTLIPGISQKMLTQQLRLLEDELIVERTVYPEVPPAVEYRLTDLGKELLPILSGMDKWGKKFVKAYEKASHTP